MAVPVDEEMITNGSYDLVTQRRQINVIMKNRPLINLKVFNSTNSISTLYHCNSGVLCVCFDRL